MSPRRASLLAWSLAAFSVVLFVASVVLFVLARSADVPESWGVNLSLTGQIGGVLYLVFPMVGALVAARRPLNPIGWILLADGLFWLLGAATDYYSVYGVASRGSLPFPLLVAGISGWLWVPAVGLMGTYVFLLFPDGRLPSRRWRPLAWSSGIVVALVSIWVWLSSVPMYNLGGARNPFGVLPSWSEAAAYVLVPLFLSCMLLSVLSLVLRYRRSRGEERQQIKWIALAASLVGLLYIAAMVGSFVYPQETWFAYGSPLWLILLEYSAIVSFVLVPLAVGVAMLRYRLYDIDLVINRALVYGTLTATLALVYFGGVTGTQALLGTLTGQRELPQLTVVASTLAIAALFNPLRLRIQTFIDRLFYRQKYDARKTLEAYAARLRDETDLDDLTEDLVGVVRETMQPEHTHLWLRDRDGTGTRASHLPVRADSKPAPYGRAPYSPGGPEASP